MSVLRKYRALMDPTDIQADVSVLLVGVGYHKRLLPLAWQVLRFGATGADSQMALLELVRSW